MTYIKLTTSTGYCGARVLQRTRKSPIFKITGQVQISDEATRKKISIRWGQLNSVSYNSSFSGNISAMHSSVALQIPLSVISPVISLAGVTSKP